MTKDFDRLEGKVAVVTGASNVAEATLTSQATSNNSQNNSSEKLASESDYLKLSRLVIEHTSRADNGRSDTLYELYAEDG